MARVEVLVGHVLVERGFERGDAVDVVLLVIGTLIFPEHIALIPNYLTFASFHALDAFAALILPFLAGGFAVFIPRQYMLGIPSAALRWRDTLGGVSRRPD